VYVLHIGCLLIVVENKQKEQSSEQPSKRATKQANEQASEQASRQASKRASKQASEQASQRASKRASKQAIEPTFVMLAIGHSMVRERSMDAKRVTDAGNDSMSHTPH